MFDSTCPLKSPTITSTKSLLISFLLICLLLLSNLPCPAESKSISSGSLAEAANSSSATLTATQQLLIDPSTSFARVYILPDGEVVSKLKWRNYTAIETRFSHLDLIQVGHLAFFPSHIAWQQQSIGSSGGEPPNRIDFSRKNI